MDSKFSGCLGTKGFGTAGAGTSVRTWSPPECSVVLMTAVDVILLDVKENDDDDDDDIDDDGGDEIAVG